jgi:transcriptional regulator with XRE-family HTH domain
MPKGEKDMTIVDSLAYVQKEDGLTQKQMSKDLHIDQSYLSRIMKGERKWPEHLDTHATKKSWKVALEIIDERTDGWIRNRWGEIDPNIAAVKERFMWEMQEAFTALGAIMMADWKDREKQRENARQAQKEIRDVVEIGMIMYGAIGEVYGLDERKENK